MDIKTAVIYRLNDLIKQKDITVNVVAVRLVVSPSTIKNILYSLSKNAALFYEKKARIKEKPLWVNPVAMDWILQYRNFLKIPSLQIWNRSYRNR